LTEATASQTIRPESATLRQRRIFLSAGEASGDAHAAAVVQALLALQPNFAVEGMGGPELAAAGSRLERRMERFSVIGFAEVLTKIPGHVRYLSQLEKRFAAGRYDLAVLVDYPGFHLRVARAAAAHGVPVVYYIAPQLWAWGERRTRVLRETVTSLAVVLPFEETFFRQRGIPTTFVGHPLLDRPAPPSRCEARNTCGIAPNSPVLGLFPGHRESEVRRMWPVFRRAARIVRHAVPDLEVVVAGVGGRVYPGADDFRLVEEDAACVMAAADAVLVKSGTTTLEAALADTPMTVVYRMHPFSHAVARRVIRCRHISLVNLVLERTVVPELIQHDATPRALANSTLRLLEPNGTDARTQREGFSELRARLGQPGAAARVARLIAELS
jgi:lipid-A-disaccharide synthase